MSQANIQGPQGWDLIVNWIMERVKRTKNSTRWRKRSKSMYPTEGPDQEIEEDDKSRSMPLLPIVTLETPSGLHSPVSFCSRAISRPSLSRAGSLR